MITLAVIWIFWCALHSFLISRIVHDAAKKMLGVRFPLYRLIYVGISIISLVPVLWYQFGISQQVLIPSNIPLLIFQAVLLIYAICMFYGGSQVYDIGYFLGLTQWRSYQKQTKIDDLPFHSDGILATVRHPWYSGGIAFLWGIGPVTDVYLLTRMILTVYIVAGTLLEETRLKKELGEEYRIYCQKVPMLIPWKKRSERKKE